MALNSFPNSLESAYIPRDIRQECHRITNCKAFVRHEGTGTSLEVDLRIDNKTEIITFPVNGHQFISAAFHVGHSFVSCITANLLRQVTNGLPGVCHSRCFRCTTMSHFENVIASLHSNFGRVLNSSFKYFIQPNRFELLSGPPCRRHIGVTSTATPDIQCCNELNYRTAYLQPATKILSISIHVLKFSPSTSPAHCTVDYMSSWYYVRLTAA
jgi:hypothetical protein